MFPTTQMNSLDIFRKWSPLDTLHAGHKFEGDFAAFNKFSWEQYPEAEVRELLASKGIPWNKNAEIEFKTKQAEYRGRVAIGTTAMTGAAFLATGFGAGFAAFAFATDFLTLVLVTDTLAGLSSP